jgi:hypothetical protein
LVPKEISNPAGATTVIPAVIDDPETVKVRVDEAVPEVVERVLSEVEPTVIAGPPLTVLDAMALVCETAPGLLKVMFPL